MAFGFPARYEESVSFGDRDAFIRVIEEVLVFRGITIKCQSPDKIMAKVAMSLWSGGQEIEIDIGKSSATIRSRCSFPMQWFDWGRNRRNVEGILRGLQYFPAV